MESTTTRSFSKECYDKANESFANEDYVKAVEMYAEALAHEPHNVDYLCARAHAHIKMDEFEKAKTDANKAIDIALKDETGRWTISLSRAFLRSGVASFNLGRYPEAKNCFLQAQRQQDEMGIKQWITWCDEKITKLGIKQDEGSGEPVAVAKNPVKEQIKTKVEEQPKDNSNTEQEKVKAEAKKEDNPLEVEERVAQMEMPTPKIKHDWYQTETQVTVK